MLACLSCSHSLEIRVRACVHGYMYMCADNACVCVCARVSARAFACVHGYVCMCARLCACMCVRVRARTCVCVCVYLSPLPVKLFHSNRVHFFAVYIKRKSVEGFCCDRCT